MPGVIDDPEADVAVSATLLTSVQQNLLEKGFFRKKNKERN